MKARTLGFGSVLLGAVLFFSMMPRSAEGLIMGSGGNAPVENRGWPTGSEVVANMKTRIASWEGPPFGGGQSHFEHRAESTKDLNEALAAFGEIAAPRLELVLRNGPAESFWLGRGGGGKGGDVRIDWEFVIWRPASWNQLFNSPTGGFFAEQPQFRQPVDPPRIIAYFGGGKLRWDEVKVPEGVTVIDQRGVAGEKASITGAVYDMDTGQAIVGAKVDANGAAGAGAGLEAAVTDAKGRFALKDLPSGTYAAVVSHEGYATRRDGEYKSLKGSDTREVIFYLSKVATLEGFVAGPDGEGVEGARVIASDIMAGNGLGYPSPEEREVKTDEKGRFSIAGLPVGVGRLNVWAKGLYYEGSVETMYPIPGKVPLSIKMVGTGTVNGTLKVAKGKQAMVRIHETRGEVVGSWGGSMNCKPDGTFEFKGVPPGEYLVGPQRGVEVMKVGDPGVHLVEVKGGQVTTLNIVE